MHILSPETDNCPSWISGRERMTVENISWSISTKECCRPRRGWLTGIMFEWQEVQTDQCRPFRSTLISASSVHFVTIFRENTLPPFGCWHLACLVKISADNILISNFYFSPDNRLWHFMQIVSVRDNFTETICMKCHILFSGKNILNLFAELTHNTHCLNRLAMCATTYVNQ